MNPRHFRVGDPVRRKSQPDAVGVIRDQGYPEEATGKWIYRVQFGSALRGVAHTELEPLPENTDPWDDIRTGTFASAEAFRTLMTFERLRRPPSPIAASFGSAKAAFYPFQFKPLLKFLENPRKRLLIADDVGLGKTIEAGYIIRELKSRMSIERVLLVVPSRLRTKWKTEMERRFGERFDIVSGQQIAALRKKVETHGEFERFFWIVSLESARNRVVAQFLEDLQPPMDIVVVDEAHRMRNPGTLQHRLGVALSACAESMVLLTATPVQTDLDNLYCLLNILDPSEFQDATLFKDRVEANRPIVRASGAIRSNPPDVQASLNAFEEMRASPFTHPLTETGYFASLLTRCRQAPSLNREEIVALQRDIDELSLTGNIISRTRKADVIPDKTVRAATVVQVRYTAVERAFYDSVAEICRVMRPDLSGWGRALAALQAFRATASCIPAAAKRFRDKLAQGGTIVDGIQTDFDDDHEGDLASAAIAHLSSDLRERLNSVLAEPKENDTKYNYLKRALYDVWQEDESAGRPPRKVVLFAFFKPTLTYLSERLIADRISSRLINGDIAIPEREVIIDEFASDRDIRVLLSSEVGSEGLDLQFASVVVNYDLPWNPMVVEQRIGRVDRIGQAVPQIVILNLVAENTIEDRVLYRLYHRIGLFKESIGELDPILGELINVEQLAADALSRDLTEEQQESLAEDSAKAWHDQRLKAEGLARNTDSLMAADQSFLDEIDGLIGRRKVPSASELHAYVAAYLFSQFPGSRFPRSLVTRVAEVRVDPEVGRRISDAFLQDPEAVRFARMLGTGAVKATFDQDTALKHANTELIHARHPLVRMVVKDRDQRRGEMPRAFALMLRASDSVDGLEGDFAFEVHLFDTGGVRPRISLVPLFRDVDGNLLDDNTSEELLLRLLDHAVSLEPRPRMESDFVESLSRRLEEGVADRRSRVGAAERELNAVRTERLRATLAVVLDHRVNEARKRLETLEGRGAAAFAISMARAKLERARHERKERLARLENANGPDVETELVAAGVLCIETVNDTSQQ